MEQLDWRSAEEILARHAYGRLGCFSPVHDESYVVPISYTYHDGSILFGCLPGKKLEYLRAHPNGVCLEVDDVLDERHWVSVVATGRFEELSGMEYLRERPRAIQRAKHGPIGQVALASHRVLRRDIVLCAVRVERLSGYRDQIGWDTASPADRP